MSIGSAIHEFLEHRELGMFLAEPKTDKRTKAGKATLAEFYDKHSETEKRIVPHDIYEQLIKVEEGFAGHRQARKILNKSKNEVTALAKISGIESKGCFDLLNQNIGMIADVKTTRRVTKREFESDCITYGYPFQMAFYSRLYEEIAGEPPKKHAIIVIETHTPHEVNLYIPDESWLEYGQKKVDQALDVYKHCLETGKFPGKQQSKWDSISLPNYMRNK